MDIFSCSCYREAIDKGLKDTSRQRLAAAIHCHGTYLSQVMNFRAELSLEQALLVCEFLNFTEEETEFFLLLVSESRAGSEKLRRRYTQKIKAVRSDRLNLKKRNKDAGTIDLKNELKFYSHWKYALSHVLLSLSRCSDRVALAKMLELSEREASEIIEFLLKLGLAIEEKGQLKHGPSHIHLGRDSESLVRHHQNFRIKSMSSVNTADPRFFHYSAATALLEKDAERIRKNLTEQLQENLGVVKASSPEEAYCLCLDFYPITK